MPHDHNHQEATAKDYVRFAAVLIGILLVSLIYELANGFSARDFMRVFMGVFFLVFAAFKLLDLPGFVMSYIGYDIIAKRWMTYAYIYPFIELALALGYFLKAESTNIFTLIFMAIGSTGVLQQLLRGSKIRCACLGTYIQLPLTTVSLIEDLAMGIMALILIIFKF